MLHLLIFMPRQGELRSKEREEGREKEGRRKRDGGAKRKAGAAGGNTAEEEQE